MNAPNILVFAYACEPGKGSEPGAGWAMARVAARMGPTWVITRANNQEAIEASIPAVPERDRLTFFYVDLPERLMRWKKGKRGIHLYYLLWQFAALRRARSLLRRQRFDFAWHVTFANIWLGSAAPLTDLPFVYGPVGGGITTPWRLLPSLGVAGAAFEVARTVVRAAFRILNPLCSLAMRRATVILVQNGETLQWIPDTWRSKAVVAPNAIVDAHLPVRVTPADPTPTALFAGELLPLKGVTLAIRAIARAPGWRLLVCGKGRDENRLRETARRLGVEGRVHFLGQRPRNEVLRLMAEEAHVFLFPSLHDEGLMVVAEALAVGLPVVCLDRGGPRGHGVGVRAGTVRATSRRLARAIMSATAQGPTDRFSLDSATERFATLLRSRGLLETQPDYRADPSQT
jgi:glycosyltransferase involved in cell wall biosynthesis